MFNKILHRATERKVTSKVKKELGNKSLAYVSRVIRGTISVAGVDAVRRRVISGIESDLKQAVKKNKQATIDELIHDALSTPDYMAMLNELSLSETHLRVKAQEAIDNVKKK